MLLNDGDGTREGLWGLARFRVAVCVLSVAHPTVCGVQNSEPWKCLTYRPAGPAVSGALVVAWQSRPLLSAVVLEMSCVKPAAATVVCERRRVLVLSRWAASCFALSGEEKQNCAF